MTDEMNWDDIPMGEEPVSEKDVKDAESMGQLPWGKFLCICIESKPREAKLKEYTTIEANLKFRIEEVIEIKGEKPDPEAAKALEGRFIFDGVLMEHAKEKDGLRKRRILIASRMGAVSPGGAMSRATWSQDVLNKMVILDTEENIYEDKKTGQMKTGSPKVKFSGYESVDGPSAQTAPAEVPDDI